MSNYDQRPTYVFFATHSPTGGIEYREPSTKVTATDNQAPHGFEGALCHRKPKFPAILITQTDGGRHVPNTLICSDDELKDWVIRYKSMFVWKHEVLGHTDAEAKASHQRNLDNISENKDIADRAIEVAKNESW